MKYMLLIYDDQRDWSELSEADRAEVMAAYRQFTQEIRSTGHYAAAAQLHLASTATSVRVRDGRRLLTDGPFAETREQLGGYYVIDATDLDEAIAIAARIPSAQHGTVEVRPVIEVPAPTMA
jgi:hypothetical protein